MPVDTLGSMAAEVSEWLSGENVVDTRIHAAINDAIDSLWSSLILAAMQIFMGGPVTLNLSATSERTTVITIADPTVVPTAADTGGVSVLPATSFQIAYTYVTESGSETLSSPVLVYARGINALAEVKIPVTVVSGAIGWNLYVGTAATNLAKQNDEPIPILTGAGNPTQQSFIEPPTGFDAFPDGPAPPTENTTGDNIFYLRHLEFKTSSGIYKAYNAGDLDSEFLRRMSSLIASTSEYQNYAWDLINQRQLEIRPALGAAFSPRYFYIVKPRRMRFANAPLPFPMIPSTEFLRDYALSMIFLSLHEYEASERWEAKSDKALIKAVRAVTQMNENRNDRVVPYLY